MERLISIIVPLYNAANYMDYCIESILKSTYQNMEILLAVSESEDTSLEKSVAWEEKDSRIRCLQVEIGGVSRARNLALREARGEYITFVDGDDCIRPDMLSILMSGIEQGAEIAGCEFEKFTNIKECAGERKIILASAPAFTLMPCAQFAGDNFLNGNTRCWGKLYSRKVLTDVSFPIDLTIGEDMIFLLETLNRGTKIALTDYKGYLYFLNQVGAMQRKFVPAYMDQISCWERAQELMKKSGQQVNVQVRKNLAMAVMLVAGKIAMLSAQEQEQYVDEVGRSRRLAKQLIEEKTVMGQLSKGYRMKIRLFAQFPRLYLKLYHLWKR